MWPYKQFPSFVVGAVQQMPLGWFSSFLHPNAGDVIPARWLLCRVSLKRLPSLIMTSDTTEQLGVLAWEFSTLAHTLIKFYNTRPDLYLQTEALCVACQPSLSQITRALSAGRFQFFQASGLTAGQSIFYKQQQTTLPSSWRLSTKPACVKQMFGSPALIHVQPWSCKVFRTFHHAADGNVWGSWNGSKL